MTGRSAEREVRIAYDEVADSYADRFPSTEPEMPLELAMVGHFASLLSGERRVLDAGCGPGRMMPVLEALGCRVEGVDLSPEMVRRAQRDHARFPSRVASMADLPFSDGSFDGVFSWYSTIHAADPDVPRLIGEAYRVLRPGGLVLVAFQCGRGVHDVSAGYRRLGHDITLHRHNRTPEKMAEILTAVGLTEVARMERAAARHERDGQAVLIAQS